MNFFEHSLSTLDRAFIARNVSLMLKSGIPISESLVFIREQTKNIGTKKMIGDIQREVESGIRFSKALEQHQRAFGSLFIQFVRIGEDSGDLEQTLGYLALQYEREHDTIKKIRSALLYPIIILGIALVYALVFAFLIFPRLEGLFAKFQGELPVLTRVVLDSASWLTSWGFILIGALVLGAILLAALRFLPGVSQFIDRMSLGIPIIRTLTKQFLFARFFQTLSYVTKNGTPIAEGLRAVQAAAPHSVMKRHLERIRAHVEEGASLSKSMEETQFFPELSIRLIAAAETSGSLENTLDYLGSFYERSIDYATKNLTSSIEPLLLIIVGLAVALLAVAIILPIYQFTGAVSLF